VLRYFGSKDEIALEFRNIGLQNFREGLLDPARKMSVLKYWRDFMESSAKAVAERQAALAGYRLADEIQRYVK